MKNEIERSDGAIERTWGGRKIRTSKEQLFQALAPMFATFPELKMSGDTLHAYHKVLGDVDPEQLSVAIIRAVEHHEYPTQLITPAAIRRQMDNREPGPRSESEDNYILPEPPPGGYKMFRLPYEEDLRQRKERLRNTAKWESKYA